MDTMKIIWAVLIVVFLIVEGAAPGLVSIWFAIGSVAGLVLAFLNISLGWQIAAFVVVSVVALIVTRPLARKYVNSKTEATNADRIIGQTGVVVEEIDNIAGKGAVKIAGKEWTARSQDGSVIERDMLVTAAKIAGATLFVTNTRADNLTAATAQTQSRTKVVSDKND